MRPLALLVIRSSVWFDDSKARIMQCLIKNLLKLRRTPALVILLQIHPQLFQGLLVATPTLDQIWDLVNRLPEGVDLLPRNNLLAERPIPGGVSSDMQNPKGCSENRLWCKRATHALSSNDPAQARRDNGARFSTETRSRRCLKPDGSALLILFFVCAILR